MNRITDLLQKPMDRRDFLKHMGMGAALVVGGTLAEKLLLDKARQTKRVAGYGSSSYGGSRVA